MCGGYCLIILLYPAAATAYVQRIQVLLQSEADLGGGGGWGSYSHPSFNCLFVKDTMEI